MIIIACIEMAGRASVENGGDLSFKDVPTKITTHGRLIPRARISLQLNGRASSSRQSCKMPACRLKPRREHVASS